VRPPSLLPWTRVPPIWIAIVALPLVHACGSGAEDGGIYSDGFDPGSDVPAGTSTGSGGGGGALPPEEELESAYGAPVATGRFVWIANPTSGRVAYIDAATLSIRVVEAGHAPTFLAPVPDPSDDVAIVLNVLSRDATVLREAVGALTTTTLEVPSGGNGWAVSPDGRYALAWTDARLVEAPDPIDGYQDVTVLDLTAGAERSTALTVGYRPVAVGFDEASSRAFAVTQDGITVIDLGEAPAVTANVKLSDEPVSDAGTRDVAITPDGALALVRREGEALVSVFSLPDGARTDVVLSAPATDLDLSRDGRVAVVVVRDTSEVLLLEVPEIATDPEARKTLSITTGGPIGSASLASDGPEAFFYTNALANPVLTVVDTSADDPAPRAILLRAPILAVFPTADAAHAIVLHDPFELSGGSKYPSALSVVPVAADLPAKILGLDAPPISVAIAPAGHRALVAVGDAQTGVFELAVASLPSLEVDVLPLASKPLSAGIVAAVDKGYVAQEHPDGRITFVDFATGEARTLTGFELASEVVTGSAR
jgi:DNA-binding beta-propeller fold protein YncE